MHRLLRILSTMLITAGVVVLADAASTLAWKEPLSTIYGLVQQGRAEDELATLQEEFPSPADLRAAARTGDPERRVGKLADLFSERAGNGKAIGRLEIDSIDLSIVAVEGTDTASLQKGPGHYPRTGFPGQGKTIGIAGHRTTYLAPFRHIDQIEDGDEVVLEMPYGTFTYTVQKHEVVDPSEVGIVRDVGYERLVLTACHPLYSAAQRWAVFAKLTGVEPLAGSGPAPPAANR